MFPNAHKPCGYGTLADISGVLNLIFPASGLNILAIHKLLMHLSVSEPVLCAAAPSHTFLSLQLSMHSLLPCYFDVVNVTTRCHYMLSDVRPLQTLEGLIQHVCCPGFSCMHGTMITREAFAKGPGLVKG